MDTVQWPQEIVVKPLDEIVTNTSTSACPKPNPSSSSSSSALERKQRPEKDQALNCPRCNSTNTKFCYYNNYSLSQPRYFCKTCRRYWTAGGSLRNIPVGGGSRKNKRSAPSSSSKSLKLPDLVTHSQNPKIEAAADHGNVSDGQDLNLGFPATHQISALELITGISSSRGLNSFMPIGSGPDPCGVFGSGYNPMQELNLKPLSFAVDGLGAGFSGLEEENGSLLFPFEDLKQVSSTSNNSDVDHQQSNKQGHHDSTSAGYWTGILGGSW